MNLYIGSDHGGYEMKGELKDHLEAAGHDIVDLGTFSEDSGAALWGKDSIFFLSASVLFL